MLGKYGKGISAPALRRTHILIPFIPPAAIVCTAKPRPLDSPLS